jgi:hypothetical protein
MNVLNEECKLKGIWTLSRVNKETGEILDTEVVHNIIVNTGKERIARMINGLSSTYFRAIAVGTGATGELVGDTALQAEVARATATLSYEASYKAKFEYTFTFGGTYSITEAGLFDSATVSGSTMLNRITFSAKSVSTIIQLVCTATITVA